MSCRRGEDEHPNSGQTSVAIAGVQGTHSQQSRLLRISLRAPHLPNSVLSLKKMGVSDQLEENEQRIHHKPHVTDQTRTVFLSNMLTHPTLVRAEAAQ